MTLLTVLTVDSPRTLVRPPFLLDTCDASLFYLGKELGQFQDEDGHQGGW